MEENGHTKENQVAKVLSECARGKGKSEIRPKQESAKGEERVRACVEH